jgi:hypothetical protein
MTRLLLCLAVLGAVGCAASREAAAPAAKSEAEPEPATLEEAQAQLDRARTELGGEAAPPESPSAMAPAPAEAPSGASSYAATHCATRCRAITSMRRAVSAICRLAGDTDARCTDAKKTLADSEQRVASCHC